MCEFALNAASLRFKANLFACPRETSPTHHMLQSHLPVVNKILSALPRSEYQRMSGTLESLELTEGELLNDVGETLLYVYFPATALLSLLALVDGVNLFSVGLLGREGMSGVASALGSQISPFRTLVLSSGQALRMKTKVFVQEFRECVLLRDVVLQYVLSLTEQIAQTAACTRYHVIEARLARLLLLTRDHLSREHFYMTHETLCQLMGVRRVGVTNAASALKARGLIDYNRGSINILDGAGLAAAACSCYTVGKTRHGRF